MSFFCCEALVAASSLPALHLLPSFPLGPVQALAALGGVWAKKSTEWRKGRLPMPRHCAECMFSLREGRMPVLHIPLLSPLEANTALLSVLGVGAGERVQSLLSLWVKVVGWSQPGGYWLGCAPLDNKSSLEPVPWKSFLHCCASAMAQARLDVFC